MGRAQKPMMRWPLRRAGSKPYQPPWRRPPARRRGLPSRGHHPWGIRL